MPALQVRDFPATLYDELKECAARNHRSIAQQTIIAVEEMLAEASAPSAARAGRGSIARFRLSRLPAARATSDIQLAFERGSQRAASAQEGRAAIERVPSRRRRQQLFARVR